MIVAMVRHGATPGTEARRYEGAGTDSKLSASGIQSLHDGGICPGVARVYTSGMRRAVQTASIVFPDAHQVSVPGLREFDFGRFEGHTFTELADDIEYRRWVEGGCVGSCPGGEDQASFVRRTLAAFRSVVEKERRAGASLCCLVAHAGTIRAVMSRLASPAFGYFDIEVHPGSCWCGVWDGEALTSVKTLRGVGGLVR